MYMYVELTLSATSSQRIQGPLLALQGAALVRYTLLHAVPSYVMASVGTTNEKSAST